MPGRNIYKYILTAALAAVIAVCCFDVSAAKRSSKNIQKEKQQNEQQIARTKKQIEANKAEIGRQVDRLESIKADIALRNDTIETLNSTIETIQAQIDAANDSIARLEVREQALKAAYAKTLRTMRTRRKNMSDLSFLFSSESFGQAWQRLRYLREFAKSSDKQARRLATTKEEMGRLKSELEALHSEQTEAVSQQKSVQTSLLAEQASADNLIKNLKSKGKNLQNEMERRRRQAKSLENELQKMIAKEEAERKAAEAKAKAEAEAKAKAEAAAKAKEEAKAKGGNTSSSSTTTTSKTASSTTKAATPVYDSEAAKDRALTGSFVSNKGQLLFPVAGKYRIVSNFGTNELPELSKVKIENSGIDIEVPSGTQARAVFEGTVSSIFRMEGYNCVIILRHGDYLTVYAGIDTPSVQKGDKVARGKELGKVYTPAGRDGTRLHFEIRHETQKLNPTEWIK